MKLRVARGELLDALAVVTKAVPARPTSAVLSGVLITATAEGGKVEIRATDLEMSIRAEILGNVEEAGSLVVAGKLLYDIVRSMPDSAVEIEGTDGKSPQVTVSSGKAKFKLRGMSVRAFPDFPEVNPEQRVQLTADVFSSLVSQVVRATSDSDSRPLLQGILVAVAGTEITATATDTYRIAEAVQQAEKATGDFQVVLPRRVMDDVARASSDSVKIGVSERQVAIKFGCFTYVSRVVEGQYPNYRAMIPADGTTTFMVDRSELIEVVKRVAIVAPKDSVVQLHVLENRLRLSTKNTDVGDAAEELEIMSAGEPLEIAFAISILLDAMESSTADELEFAGNGSAKPATLRAAGYLHLIMPRR